MSPEPHRRLGVCIVHDPVFLATYSQVSHGSGRLGGQAETAVVARSARTVAHLWRGPGSFFARQARTGRRGRFGWGTSSGEPGRGLPLGGGRAARSVVGPSGAIAGVLRPSERSGRWHGVAGMLRLSLQATMSSRIPSSSAPTQMAFEEILGEVRAQRDGHVRREHAPAGGAEIGIISPLTWTRFAGLARRGRLVHSSGSLWLVRRGWPTFQLRVAGGVFHLPFSCTVLAPHFLATSFLHFSPF